MLCKRYFACKFESKPINKQFTLLAVLLVFWGLQFTRIKMKRQTNDVLLTEEQKHWNLIMYSLSNMKFPLRVDAPEGEGRWMDFRRFMFRCIVANWFDSFIMICIVLVTISMMLPHHNQKQVYDDLQIYLNYIFSGIFCMECLMKVIALSWSGYMRSGWNKFDLVLVISSLLDLSMSFMTAGFLRVLRFGRLTRITRIRYTIPDMIQKNENMDELEK